MTDAVQEIRDALRDPNVSLHLVNTFNLGRAVQVKIKSRKIGPLLFPGVGETLADLFTMIGQLATDPQIEEQPE